MTLQEQLLKLMVVEQERIKNKQNRSGICLVCFFMISVILI